MKPKRNGAAQRDKMFSLSNVNKQIDNYNVSREEDTKQNYQWQATPNKLKIVALGGQEKGGGQNMIVIEYGEEAIVTDTGFNLSVNLPGINYGIADISYLEKIKHKVKGYVYTHGHLDHIGAAPYVIPKVPATVYGSKFTIGMVEKQFEDGSIAGNFKPQTVVMNIDNQEQVRIGSAFSVELVRVTHSIPECGLVVIDTPVGKIVNTGDFRLDPEPLDHLPTNVERIKQIGDEGVLLLMSESTTTERPGRTPTEHTLQPSFLNILKESPGRVFVATFSTNINRAQMIMNGAVESGRKVAIDGRSMLATMELAVRLGYLKVPSGVVVPMRAAVNIPDKELVVVATGSQGEENAALQRMSTGEHKHVNLKPGDTVVFSSTPIPYSGNDASVRRVTDDLFRRGVKVFRQETHEIDGIGPLHVSGHASMDEYKEMIEMVRPKFFIPIYGDYTSRIRHRQLAIEAGVDPRNVALIDNGEVVELDQTSLNKTGKVPVGTLLIDNSGALVPGLVVKDRLLISENGIVVVILTMNKAGQLLASPDIITRGLIYMRDNQELMNGLRERARQFSQTRFTRSPLDRFKQDLRDDIHGYLFNETGRSSVVISVVNVIGSNSSSARRRPTPRPSAPSQPSRA